MTQFERPQPVDFTPRGGTITAGGSAQPLAPANTKRAYLFIQNLDASHDLWFDFGVTAVIGQPSIRLTAGSSQEWNGPRIPRQAISVIGSTTGQAFTAKEA
jgi:hypothetical protein